MSTVLGSPSLRHPVIRVYLRFLDRKFRRSAVAKRSDMCSVIVFELLEVLGTNQSVWSMAKDKSTGIA